MRSRIDDYYTIVYLLGWVVAAAGIFITLRDGLTGTDNYAGVSLILGGMYIASFVTNSKLKLKVMMLEKELGKD